MSYCVICTEALDGETEVLVTTCGHVYHSECLHRWLMQSASCPSCRTTCCKSTLKKIVLSTNSENTDAVKSLEREISKGKLRSKRRYEQFMKFKKNYKSLFDTLPAGSKTESINFRKMKKDATYSIKKSQHDKKKNREGENPEISKPGTSEQLQALINDGHEAISAEAKSIASNVYLLKEKIQTVGNDLNKYRNLFQEIMTRRKYIVGRLDNLKEHIEACGNLHDARKPPNEPDKSNL